MNKILELLEKLSIDVNDLKGQGKRESIREMRKINTKIDNLKEESEKIKEQSIVLKWENETIEGSVAELEGKLEYLDKIGGRII